MCIVFMDEKEKNRKCPFFRCLIPHSFFFVYAPSDDGHCYLFREGGGCRNIANYYIANANLQWNWFIWYLSVRYFCFAFSLYTFGNTRHVICCILEWYMFTNTPKREREWHSFCTNVRKKSVRLLLFVTAAAAVIATPTTSAIYCLVSCWHGRIAYQFLLGYRTKHVLCMVHTPVNHAYYQNWHCKYIRNCRRSRQN